MSRVRLRRRLSFSVGVHLIVFQAEIPVIVACVKNCLERHRMGEENLCLFRLPGSFAKP
jgi:hypothetical protein